MSKEKKQPKRKILTLRRWIILSVYAAASFVIPLIVYLIMAKTDKVSQKDWIVVIPIVILIITFILWNIYGGQITKNRFYATKTEDRKKKKAFEASAQALSDIRLFILLLCAVEVVIIVVMAFVVYFTL